MRLSNRVVLITGAGSGIGKAMALHCAKEGADIVLGDLKAEFAQETAKSIESLGRHAFPLKVDISQSEEVQLMVTKAYETFERIDVLINNAGIFPVPAPVVKLSEKVFDQCMAVNLRGTFLCSKYIGQKMIRQKNISGSELRGKIINIASMAGKEGWPLASAYCASKFGVIGLTQAMAKEVAPHVTVNAICPGLVKTPLWGPAQDRLNEVADSMNIHIYMKRFAVPEDVTPLAVFLASADSDYITGQSFDVSGGITFH